MQCATLAAIGIESASELGLRRRRGHAQDRRVDKECGAFVHGVPVAGKAKTAEIIEKAVVESAGALEPIDFISREAKILQKIDRLLQPGGEQKAAPRYQTAGERVPTSRCRYRHDLDKPGSC